MQCKLCRKNLDAFHALSCDTDEVLRAVYEREVEQCREGLVLVFTTKALVFRANADDDTLSVECRRISTARVSKLLRKSTDLIWDRFVGKAFGWGWVTVNQQGYCDGALVSFNGIRPNVSLGVMASSIETGIVQPDEEVKIETVSSNGSFIRLPRLPQFFSFNASPAGEQPVS
jgi:hypothetical protein